MAKDNTKKNLAKTLYLNTELTQKQIAEKTGCSVNSVYRWAKQDNWEELKLALSNTADKELPRLYKQLKEFNDYIDSKPQGERFGTSKEYDALNKLKSVIAALDKTSLSQTITVFQNFLKWVQRQDADKAKEFADVIDAYIKTLA